MTMRFKHWIKIGVLGILLVFVGVKFVSQLGGQSATAFSDAFVVFARSLMVLLLLALVFFASFFPAPEAPSFNPKVVKIAVWFFGGSLLLIVLASLVVNPLGLYGFHFFPQLANGLKQEKVQYYQQQEQAAEVVILGSSRTLTISPAYIQDTLGYSAFNLGFSGVTPVELSLLGEMITADAQETPLVTLIEVSPSNLRPMQDAQLTEVPLELLPYMSGRQAASMGLSRYLALFNLYQFSETLYVLQYFGENRTPQNYWQVQPDGYSLYYPPDTLKEALARQLGERDTLNPCQYYTKDGDAIFDQLTSLAEENDMALVFYFSPIHPTFQTEYLDESADYKWCKRIFDEVVAEAAASPNVYYLDLSDAATAGLETDGNGFYDGFHITPASADKLIDALAPTITEAYQYARSLRGGQP